MTVSDRRGLEVIAGGQRDQHRPSPWHEPPARDHREMRYQFTLAERLSDDTLIDFPELLEATDLAGHWGTVLFGVVTDRAHLYELLQRCDVLGLTVMDLRVLPD